jgi:hypothetical protein
MKRTLMTAAAAVGLLAAVPAHAGIVCNMTDTVGNALTYSFVGNSHNIDGSFGGTMVEDGFMKNGRATVSPIGNRPIWIFTGNVAGGFNLYSREARGWHIDVAGGQAGLYHGGRFAGSGSCGVLGGYATANNVGDQGYTN